jgi:thiol:disulfide interchange protein
VELGDALLGRWMLHVLLTPVASLLAWALWLPLHRASDSWVLRFLGAVVFFAAGAFRYLRVAQLFSLPLDWSHMRLHASVWAGTLFLAMAIVELYTTCRTVSTPCCQYSGTSRYSETRIRPHLEVGRMWDYMREVCDT